MQMYVEWLWKATQETVCSLGEGKWQPGMGVRDCPWAVGSLGLLELLFIYFRICLHHLSKTLFFFRSRGRIRPKSQILTGSPDDHTWDPSLSSPSPSLFWLFRRCLGEGPRWNWKTDLPCLPAKRLIPRKWVSDILRAVGSSSPTQCGPTHCILHTKATFLFFLINKIN